VRVLDLIDDKKRGREHSPAEIEWLVKGFAADEVPDYQMAAWLMAVRFQGMSPAETAALTKAMAESGETLNLEGLPRPWLDKHSTGGVGDKLTLVVVPILIAAGATCVKLSGRGLGHTGGTADKLESIPGFRTRLSAMEILESAARAGGCLAAHSASLVPADAKMYALRDATGTVDSLPLIAASIMSKKLACGAGTILLDVKVGRGALLPDRKKAAGLARTMVGLAARSGRRAVAVLTPMDQPVGLSVGNALEVEEALAVLRGEGPGDVRALSIALAAEGLHASGLAVSGTDGAEKAARMLDGGRALEAFARVVAVQGGDPGVVFSLAALPRSRLSAGLPASAGGTVAAVDALAVGQSSVLLGAGRSRKGEKVDPGAGVALRVRAGDRVAAGDLLGTVYAADSTRLRAGLARLQQAFVWAGSPPAADTPFRTADQVIEVIREP